MKLIGLNSKYVFPPHALMMWFHAYACTHMLQAATQSLVKKFKSGVLYEMFSLRSDVVSWSQVGASN